MVQLLDVVHRVLKFFLGGPEDGHFIDFMEFIVDVFGLDEGILQSLINHLLFLFGHLTVHISVVAAPFLSLARRLDGCELAGQRLTVLLLEGCGSSLSQRGHILPLRLYFLLLILLMGMCLTAQFIGGVSRAWIQDGNIRLGIGFLQLKSWHRRN